MKKIIIILIFMMSFFIGCIVLYFGSTIEVINGSDDVIYACFSDSDSLDVRPMVSLYINFNLNGKDTVFYGDGRVEPDSIGSICFPGRRKYFVKQYGKDEKVRFFFIKESTLLEKTWNEIYEGQLYEKRLTFTQEDLESMDWTVVYNP